MFQVSTHLIPEAIRQRAHLDNDAYLNLYRQSIERPEVFWSEQAESFLSWFKPWDSVCHSDMHKGEVQWFKGGQLNVSYN